MVRTLKFALLVVMLVLVPLRAFAALTTDCCLNEETSAVTAPHAGHDASHEHPDAPQDSGVHEHCNTCVAHCASAALVSAAALSVPAAADDRGTVFVLPLVASFVPEHLDRPPLAG